MNLIKIQNYCKADGIKHIGIKGIFEDKIDGEILPCPICGRTPIPMVRFDNMSDEPPRYFAAVSCFAGGGASHSYVSAKGQEDYMKVLNTAISDWNNGNIDYYERLDNVFRSCYSCTNFDRENGCAEGVCKLGVSTKPFRGCKIDYNKMSHDEFTNKLTRLGKRRIGKYDRDKTIETFCHNKRLDI